MSNLTRTAFFSRKIAFGGAIAVIATVTFILLTSIGKSILRVFVPPQPPPATVAFGKLPPLDFSGGFKPPSGVNYSVQTVSGNLPKLDLMTNVFEVNSPATSFGDSAKSKAKSQKLGFGDTPIETVGVISKFADSKSLNRVLTMDTTNGNFEIESNYLTKIEVLGGKPKSQDEAKTTAELFIKDALAKINFADTKTATVFYKIDGSKLTEVSSIGQANLVAFKYARADIEKKKVVYDNYINPEYWVLVFGKDIIAAHNGTLDLELNKFSTYPLRGVAKAFDELKKGNAIYNRGPIENLGGVEISTSIATQLKPFAEGKFSIFSVELGYLITSKYEAYLQPVYIFNGDNNVAAYVSAVDDAWIDHSDQK